MITNIVLTILGILLLPLFLEIAAFILTCFWHVAHGIFSGKLFTNIMKFFRSSFDEK